MFIWLDVKAGTGRIPDCRARLVDAPEYDYVSIFLEQTVRRGEMNQRV